MIPESTMEPSVNEADLPARLLVIDGRRTLGLRLVPSLADELPMVPMLVDVTTGRSLIDFVTVDGKLGQGRRAAACTRLTRRACACPRKRAFG